MAKKKDWTRRDIEHIVRTIIDDKMERSTAKFMTKKDVQKMIKADIEKFEGLILKKTMSDKETKEMIKKSLVNLYRFLWEKSHFFIRNI